MMGLKKLTMKNTHQMLRLTLLNTSIALLAACGTTQHANRAPVEDRGTGSGRTTSSDVAGDPASVKPPLPGAENAGKPGYYTIKPGDTLIRIGLENGQSWHDIVRWNNLDNPNRIEAGQVVRIVPPDGVAVARPVGTPGAAVGSPLPNVGAVAVKPAIPESGPVTSVVAAGDDDIAWIWPASGSVLAGFDEAKNKGLDFNGKAGDPVVAVADGKVVYAGSGLRGYGNLIILKHNNTYLTAYAHNQTLLIKEDQFVRKGQKIAEMGNSDADRVKLHFEIRRQGKPVDPAKYLPAR